MERVLNTDKKIYIQWGFTWKGASRRLSNKQEVVDTINRGYWAHYDIDEDDESIQYTFYSANDMW